jgi:acyl dehydratase
MPPRLFPTIDELRPLVGQEIAASDWRVLSQDLIDAFAATTGDRQWIHVDADRARRESPYGATIAHGFLTLSLLSRLYAEAIQIGGVQRLINYGLNRVRFPAPVRSGSRMRARLALQAFEDLPGGTQLTWLVTVEVDGEPKPALVAEWLLRYYR